MNNIECRNHDSNLQVNPVVTHIHVLWLCPLKSFLWQQGVVSALGRGESVALPVQLSDLSALPLSLKSHEVFTLCFNTASAYKNFTAQPAYLYKIPFLWSLFPVLFYWTHFTPFSGEGDLFFFYNDLFRSSCVSHSFFHGIISCTCTLNSTSDICALRTFCRCPLWHLLHVTGYIISSFNKYLLNNTVLQDLSLHFEFSAERKKTNIKLKNA